MIVVPTVVAAVVTSVLTARFLPTRYRSETTLAVIPQRVDYPSSSASDGTSQLNVLVKGQAERLELLREALLSGPSLRRIIRDFNLVHAEADSDLIAAFAERMRRDIAVAFVSRDSVQDGNVVGLTVSFTSSDPNLALRITERLAQKIIQDNSRDREVLVKGSEQFLESQIEDVRKRIISYEATLDDLRARSGGRPLSQADLVPYEVLLDRYRDLHVRSEDVKAAVAIERRQIGEQFRIFDAPRLPEQPVGPSRQEVNVAGTTAGLALGLIVVANRRRRKNAA